jgi:acetyl-CoA decarbonylase/synthase complex subunit delta
MKGGDEDVKRLARLLAEAEELELQGVDIRAEELELTVRPSEGIDVGALVRQELGRLLAGFGQALIGGVGTQSQAPPKVEEDKATEAAVSVTLPAELKRVEFKPPVREYPGRVVEVTIGATRSEGGTRGRTITVGGARTPAFHLYEGVQLHPPVVAGDVFDIPITLPKPVKACFGDALQDPADWARVWVEKVGVELIDLELVSTDPYIKDTPVQEAVRVVENVLQAVDVPLIVGGSGNPEKDAELLPKVAAACEGERVVLSSATLDMWEPVAKAAKEHNQLVLAWTSIDVNQAKELNRRLFEYVPPDRVLIDPTSAALGYGLEYAFTVMERIRLGALLGDEELQSPQASGTANAWGAREAWRKDPGLGPREFRGPLWEAVGALAYLMAGVDVFIMLHPGAARTVRDVVGWLSGGERPPTFPEWIGLGR